MIMYLLNEGKRLHPQISNKDLRAEVNKRVELSHSKFLKTVTDKLFVEKGILNMAASVEVVDFRNNMYFYEGAPLAEDGEPSHIGNAALFIKGTKRGSMRVAISKATLDKFNASK